MISEDGAQVTFQDRNGGCEWVGRLVWGVYETGCVVFLAFLKHSTGLCCIRSESLDHTQLMYITPLIDCTHPSVAGRDCVR